MKALITILTVAVALATAEQAPQVIAKNEHGVVVHVKEKYGTFTTDTCTVVMLINEQFVLVHREGVSSWYPTAFHSVQVMETLGGEEALTETDTRSAAPLTSTGNTESAQLAQADVD